MSMKLKEKNIKEFLSCYLAGTTYVYESKEFWKSLKFIFSFALAIVWTSSEHMNDHPSCSILHLLWTLA